MQTLAPEELVRLCQRTLPDDTRAFELLVSMYKERVFATAYRLMGNRQDAEDQAQEVFLKIYRGIRQLEDPGMFTSWVYLITTNTCFDALSKQKRRPQTTPLDPPDENGNEEPRYADAQTPGPEQTALRREVWDCLEQTLRELDAQGRTALILRDIEGGSILPGNCRHSFGRAQRGENAHSPSKAGVSTAARADLPRAATCRFG